MNIHEYIEAEAQKKIDELLKESQETGKDLRIIAQERGFDV